MSRGYSATYFILCAIPLLTMFSASLIIPLLSIFAVAVSTGLSRSFATSSLQRPSLRPRGGAAIGIYRTFIDLGSILGPIIMSVVQETSGATVCFYMASALLFANMIPTLKISESR